MRKCLAVLCLFVSPCLFAQDLRKLVTRTAGGLTNGNWWAVLATDEQKAIWALGFVEGGIARGLNYMSLEPCPCDCPEPWPKGGLSIGAMVAELDAFYADKQNRLIPVMFASHALAKKIDGRHTRADFEMDIVTLRKVHSR